MNRLVLITSKNLFCLCLRNPEISYLALGKGKNGTAWALKDFTFWREGEQDQHVCCKIIQIYITVDRALDPTSGTSRVPIRPQILS